MVLLSHHHHHVVVLVNSIDFKGEVVLIFFSDVEPHLFRGPPQVKMQRPSTDEAAVALAAVSMEEDEDDEEPRVAVRTSTSGNHNDPTSDQSQQDRLRAALARQKGIVEAPTATVAPYGGDDEELCCGVCLDTPGPGQLATLWCCKQVLCIKDAQHIGACPFCREEPLVWELGLPSEINPE